MKFYITSFRHIQAYLSIIKEIFTNIQNVVYAKLFQSKDLPANLSVPRDLSLNLLKEPSSTYSLTILLVYQG